MRERRCRYCQKSFQASKFRPLQTVCSEAACQRQRRTDYHRERIAADPEYRDGQYYEQGQGPVVGLAIARMLGHITYLSREAMTQKFDAERFHPRSVQTQFETKFSVGSYLAYQGDRFGERFDPNSYLTLTMAIDLFDLGDTREKLAQAVDEIELGLATQLVEVASTLDPGPSEAATDDRDDGPADTGTIVGANVRSRVAPFAGPPSALITRIDSAARTSDAVVPTAGCADRVPAAARIARPDVEVEVGVLGTVQVHGAARGFTRAWALELVVYLAMHPGGAANEVWATALWPDRLMAPSSLHSTVSVARRALGSARDGSDHLPRSHGRLALASTVGTDWARFQSLADSEDPDRWEAALTVVRGRPFEGIRATDWSLLDGTAPSIEAAVVDLSGRLAGARLRSGDPYGAEWAARKGLLVSPYDERLYRMLLRTADAAGNPEGVETVMAELVRVVADEVEPVESVHPSTLALYRSLSRRSRSFVDAPPPR